MDFSLKINFTVFLIIINFISVKGFSYTFYVETSEFNDDVYIIENVISDASNNESDKKLEELEFIQETKSNINSIKNPIIKSEIDKENFREYSVSCTNLKSKPILSLNKEFKDKSYKKGINEKSLKKAKDYWDMHEARDSLDECKKLNQDHLLLTANSLNRLLIKENINLAQIYPKVYYFNNSNIENIENLSMNTKNKYLGELFKEISNLRKELLSTKGNKIIYDNYYHYLIDKSDYNKLNNDEKIFLSNYRQFNVNSKILEFGYDEKSFLQKNNSGIYSNQNTIGDRFFSDISPMMDLFFISSDPENLQSSPAKIRKVSAPILSKFSEIMNNL
mgnify:FL=1